MSGSASSNGQKKALKTLQQRAEQILKARPAYREMVDFYLTVFRRQIEWRPKLAVHPQEVGDDQRRQCLGAGKPLIECYDPGIESESLLDLWIEMKAVFRRGNDVLRDSVDRINDAEKAGSFVPATWLPEQRPDRAELVMDACRQIGVGESVLATLTRAVTFPHWQLVSERWLPDLGLDRWGRSRCPTCGGPPGLVEIGTAGRAGDGITAAPKRLMHCPFCGCRWVVPGLKCPACDSTRSGDAKYYFTTEEPELRVDFCNKCNHYVKVVNADKIAGRLHIGLELLTTAHLDAIAQDKNLRPLEACS
ncbi:MAG: formate dehydrogenase accessory protein FdhE [Phycisphaerae bacterium]|nr:formate dehydrogenase accessory protein FdhE [Phycisphaerae bacterium]